jgi:hypothetical protein
LLLLLGRPYLRTLNYCVGLVKNILLILFNPLLYLKMEY